MHDSPDNAQFINFPPENKNAIILVADDHAPNRELLEEVLAAAGFTVLMAEDGAAALQKFKRSKPDLVGRVARPISRFFFTSRDKGWDGLS